MNINTPNPAHRVINNVPEDDFVRKVTPPENKKAAKVVCTSKTTKGRKKVATTKKSAPPDPPSASSPPKTVDLVQKLVDAGLNPAPVVTKHELSESHIAEVRKARKEKYDKIIQELDEEEEAIEARKVKDRQGTLMAYWDEKQNLANCADFIDEIKCPTNCPEVMTQFSQFSEETCNDDKTEEDSLDEIQPPDSRCNTFKYSSSVTNVTRTVNKKVQLFDLTHSGSSDDEIETCKKPVPKKERKGKVEVKEKKEQPCVHCMSDVCHDTLFGNYCFAKIQKYFSEDKLLANRHNAEKIYVKAYNAALDYHMFCTTSSVTEYPTLFPPTCIRTKGMMIALQWFETEKDKYTRYIRSSRVASRRVRNKENFKKDWEEYEKRIRKRKYGGIQD